MLALNKIKINNNNIIFFLKVSFRSVLSVYESFTALYEFQNLRQKVSEKEHFRLPNACLSLVMYVWPKITNMRAA